MSEKRARVSRPKWAIDEFTGEKIPLSFKEGDKPSSIIDQLEAHERVPYGSITLFDKNNQEANLEFEYLGANVKFRVTVNEEKEQANVNISINEIGALLKNEEEGVYTCLFGLGKQALSKNPYARRGVVVWVREEIAYKRIAKLLRDKYPNGYSRKIPIYIDLQ